MLPTSVRIPSSRLSRRIVVALPSLVLLLALAACASSAPPAPVYTTPFGHDTNALQTAASDFSAANQATPGHPAPKDSAYSDAPRGPGYGGGLSNSGAATDGMDAPDGQTYIGTYTAELDGGASYTLTYSVGQPTTDDSSPDIQAAVASCGDITPGRSVYVPYTVTLHYSGQVPLTVDYGNNPGQATDTAMLDDFGQAGSLDIPIAYSDGNWVCNSNALQFQAFPPGGSATFKAVFIANGYLTNSQPTFDPSAHTNWNVNGSEVLFLQQDLGSITFSGPNKCPHGRGGLSLFGTADQANC